MNKKSIDPKKIIQEALTYLDENKITQAFEKYLFLYENSYPQYSLFAMGQMASEHKFAKEKLTKIKNNHRNDFMNTLTDRSFNKYLKVCETLESKKELIELFHKFRKNNKKWAEEIFYSQFDYFVEKKEWAICFEYFEGLEIWYDSNFEAYDTIAERQKHNPEAVQGAVSMIFRFTQKMSKVYRGAKAIERNTLFEKKLKKDLEQRRLSHLFEKIVY